MVLPPAQPAYILRGHRSQIHVTCFIRRNARLVTGDAEGWVVVWDLAIKRPTAVWRAHEASILGIGGWGNERLITHGKDNKLLVWKLNEEEEASMSTVLPVNNSEEPHKQPWLLHMLHVNTMNFCSFAQSDTLVIGNPAELLVAVPDTVNSETVDIYHLPSSTKFNTVPASPLFKGGMVMSLSLFYHPKTTNLTVIAAFESGHTSINHLVKFSWETLYIAKPHSQPVLSLAVAPEKNYYVTSSADANIAQHMIPSSASESIEIETIETVGKDKSLRIVNTKHSGQQGIKIRNDGKIFATAGWDGRVRVYGCKSMREMAVLKWHREGCYTLDFTEIYESSKSTDNKITANRGSDTDICASSMTNLDKNASGWEQPENQVIKGDLALNIREEREWKARNTHWIAVGSKDGKISLWDIY